MNRMISDQRERAEAFAAAMRELHAAGRITPPPPSEPATALAEAVRLRPGQAPEPEPEPPVPDRRADYSQGRVGAVSSSEQRGREFVDALNALRGNRSAIRL